MNRTEILAQRSTTHVAATVDNHVAGPFRTAHGWQGVCQCGEAGPADVDMQLAGYWTLQHKRAVR